MVTEISAPLTWHLRIVKAVAERTECTIKVRSVPRIIGSRKTTKSDRLVSFEGSNQKAAEAAASQLIGSLNLRSDDYMRALPADLTSNERKVARRIWLEQEAAKSAAKLLTGGNNG